MRPVSATMYALQIPFIEAFKHKAKERTLCDSVVIRVQDETGTEGFGEGVPRPYVTGETADTMSEHLARDLWPAVVDRELHVLGIFSKKEIDVMTSGSVSEKRMAPRAMEIAESDGRVASTDADFGKAASELNETDGTAARQGDDLPNCHA